VEFLQDMEDTELMAGIRPQLGKDRRIEVRAVGDHNLGDQTPGPEILEETPHVVLVVAGDRGEGHRQVLERIGRQQQGVAAQV
jgi:hypothetical protein